MLDQLNEITRQAAVPEDTGFTAHPMGEFSGVVYEVSQKSHNNTPIYEIKIKTAHGTCKHAIWGYTQQDVQKMAAEPKYKEQVQNNIGRHKRLFVDLGVWSEDQAQAAGWSAGDCNILNDLQKLGGKKCRVVIKPNHNNPAKTVMFVNKASGQPDALMAFDSGPGLPAGEEFGDPSMGFTAPQMGDIPPPGFDDMPIPTY